MSVNSGFPRASNSNLLASSPLIVPGLKSSSTAIDTAVTANQGQGTAGAGVSAAGILIYDAVSTTFLRSGTMRNFGDADSGAGFIPIGMMIFNGATYDRIRAASGAGAALSTGVLAASAHVWQGVNTISPVVAPLALTDNGGNNSFTAAGIAFNGSSFDRLRTSAAVQIAATTQPFQLATALPGEWSITAAAGAGNQSTASKAAGAAGVRHVLRSFDFSVTGVAGGQVTINVRDGATGAGTILRQYVIDVLIGTTVVHGLAGLSQFGTAATAMTIEQAAGVANIVVTVNASGYSTI